MANKTMLKICRLLDECDGCARKQKFLNDLNKEEKIKMCAGCPIYERLVQMRPLIDDEKPNLQKRILAKGEDMTTSEIAYLIKHGVKKKDIQEALGMDEVYFREILCFLGLIRPKRKKVSG